ncbi:MAG: glycerol-3-phosphate acyltransferase, partial [Candidatus Eremiobacteraeota bacterium]|nr:glycerol-3-phosphate acyltransferase [Candidatus Eremiobacteraeota bacterium]
MNTALACAFGFLSGSIPFGFVIGKVFYNIDIRKAGSGNIGAANALRTMGKTGAAVVLLLDAAKGFAP